MSCGTCGQSCEKDFQTLHAKRDIYQLVCEMGQSWTFRITEETGVRRDDYRSIKERATDKILAEVHAFPINFSPTPKQIERAGVKADTDAIIYTAALSWDRLGLRFNDVDMIRWVAEYGGRTYKIISVNRDTQVGHCWGYWIFGLRAD